jgi:hypothetical protein
LAWYLLINRYNSQTAGGTWVQELKGDDDMNDFFLKNWNLQRHEEILAEVRAAQLSQRGRSRVILASHSIRRFRSFYAKCKNFMASPLPEAVERKAL